jgi:hypothetical protein
MAAATNDDDDLLDSDDDELVENAIHDMVTKDSFLSTVEAASEGADFLKIINLLPNSSQR